MGDFDTAGRYLIQQDPPGFFSWVAPRFVRSWTFRRWVATKGLAFPGDKERECDTVAEFVHKDDPSRRCLMDSEVQTRPHPDMLERLGEYAIHLRRERRYGRGRRGKYDVYSILLNLTGPIQPDILDMTTPDLGGSGLWLRPLQITLREEDAASTLARIAAGELRRCILPWVVMMRGASESGMIEEWCKLARQERKKPLQGELVGLAKVFADLTRYPGRWHVALEGWNVERSQTVMGWEANAIRRILVNVLRAKFRAIPHELEATLAAIKAPDELGRLIEAASLADSLDSFRAATQS